MSVVSISLFEEMPPSPTFSEFFPVTPLPVRTSIVAIVACFAPKLASAQSSQPDSTRPRPLSTITVTATRTARPLFQSASPVLVVDSAAIRHALANGTAEMLRQAPGMDITGSGTNQGRPIIRGQRGQRILLLEDGIRLNNSRRQQDFGEIPALVGMDDLNRIEVVRGPASVLYGTDAIGGVINLITMHPLLHSTGKSAHGNVGYRFSSSDQQQRPSGSLTGNVGRLGFAASLAFRETQEYRAPAGSFGNVTLSAPTTVHGTGVRDGNMAVALGYGLSSTGGLIAKYSRYHATNAGFGYVDNSDLATPDAATIDIRYPSQSYDKVSLQYRANAIGSGLADRADVTTYLSANARTLSLGVFAPFGPGTPPGAGVLVGSHNAADVSTIGLRAEAAKVVGAQVITYGVDYFRDRSNNTDSSKTTVVGFGPPQSTINDTAQTPNATFQSVGLFGQSEVSLTDRFSAVIGGRWQSVTARTRVTPRVTTPLTSMSRHTVVGALNLSYLVRPGFNLIGSVGRAFRSPNLIELFFNGATPEGSGYQIRSPTLRPETSIDIDLGLKVLRGGLYAEVVVFQNDVRDGIRIAPTGTKVGTLAAYQNINVDRLRDRGAEVLAQLDLGGGFHSAASYTTMSSTNIGDANRPVGDSYSSKATAGLQWHSSHNAFWAGYQLRHNGSRKDVELGESPIGPVLPSFTVQDAQVGAELFHLGHTTHSLTLAVNNLGNQLYAEFSNAGFFRPEAKRSLTAAWTTHF